jgi:hypothetical protein
MNKIIPAIGFFVCLGGIASAQGGFQARYKVGDRVRFSVSGQHSDFQSCTVSENPPGGLMRVRCNAFKAWAAGNYIVYGASHLAPSGAAAAPRPKPAAMAPPAAAAATRKATPASASGGGLKQGEYACYGSGGRIMIGLGFKVLAGGRYTDLEGGNAGTYAVSGTNVSFKGGHLGGQTGRDLKNGNFRIGAQAGCEPF